MAQTKSRDRIELNGIEFLIIFSHNDSELEEFKVEKARLLNIINSDSLGTQVKEVTLKEPLPKTNCYIWAGAPGTKKEDKVLLVTGTAVKHEDDSNNRIIARFTAFTHAVENKDFLEYLEKNKLTARQFKKETISSLRLRCKASQDIPKKPKTLYGFPRVMGFTS